jgi:hypothetical protein
MILDKTFVNGLCVETGIMHIANFEFCNKYKLGGSTVRLDNLMWILFFWQTSSFPGYIS